MAEPLARDAARAAPRLAAARLARAPPADLGRLARPARARAVRRCAHGRRHRHRARAAGLPRARRASTRARCRGGWANAFDLSVYLKPRPRRARRDAARRADRRARRRGERRASSPPAEGARGVRRWSGLRRRARRARATTRCRALDRRAAARRRGRRRRGHGRRARRRAAHAAGRRPGAARHRLGQALHGDPRRAAARRWRSSRCCSGSRVLLIVGNTIRLDIEARRAEIEVMKLVGGSDGFVRRPFLYGGFWYGLGGGLVAWLLVVAFVLSSPARSAGSRRPTAATSPRGPRTSRRRRRCSAAGRCSAGSGRSWSRDRGISVRSSRGRAVDAACLLSHVYITRIIEPGRAVSTLIRRVL